MIVSIIRKKKSIQINFVINSLHYRSEEIEILKLLVKNSFFKQRDKGCFTIVFGPPNNKKSRNPADILLSIFLHYLRSIFTHFSLFLSLKTVRKYCRKMGSRISALFFTWEIFLYFGIFRLQNVNNFLFWSWLYKV